MSNTGFGQDRPYGAIDDDDDFIDEWHASWEPAARTHVDDVIEPVQLDDCRDELVGDALNPVLADSVAR